MKVIYTKTILDKIQEELIKAKQMNKTIEKIVLSGEEYDSLVNEMSPHLLYGCYPHNILTVTGILIEKEQPEPIGTSHLRVYSTKERVALGYEVFKNSEKIESENIVARQLVTKDGRILRFVCVNSYSSLYAVLGTKYDEVFVHGDVEPEWGDKVKANCQK